VPADDTVLINLSGRDRDEPASLASARWLRRSNRGWVPEELAAAQR
jgi:hypothetical protein